MKSFLLSRTFKVALGAVLLTLSSSAILAQELEKTPAVKVDPAPVTAKPGTLTSFAPIVEKVAPSVVTISTSRNMKNQLNQLRNNPLFNDPMFRRFFGIPDPNEDSDTPPAPQRRGGRGNNPGEEGRRGARPQALGLGSGVIVSGEGHILTNNHVVEGADDIVVTIGNNRREYKAKKIGSDPATDVAVLKIDATSLPAITFGDSDKLRVGDIVIAVGNPFGLTQSVSQGVVSAIGRGGMNIVDYENFIQTDASINPGNSGGALVDIEGRLIGINTAIFSRSGGNQGIGFAVPANLAHGVMDSIIKNGRVVRGFIGAYLQPLDEELSSQFKTKDQSGALIAELDPKGPAAKAGIKRGDVITGINGKKVEGPRELRLTVASMPPGSKVELKVLRDGEERAIPIELGELPSERGVLAQEGEKKSDEPDVLDGVTVSDIDDALRKELDLPADAEGVVITNVDPDSQSAAAGLKRGDVIHEINREPVTSAKQAVDLSEKVKKEKKVLLRVSTKGQSRFIVVGQNE